MRTIAWGKLKEVLEAKGILIEDRGSEKKLTMLLPGGMKRVYILQHECCRSKSSDVWATHLRRIKLKFDLTEEDLRR
jgi:hypothetical protein